MTLTVIWTLMVVGAILAAVVSYVAGFRAGVEAEQDRVARWQRHLERAVYVGGEAMRAEGNDERPE